jgi:hypothetical protein
MLIEIERLIPLIDEVRSQWGVRFILSPKPKLETATSLTPMGRRKFLIEYRPDVECTDEVAESMLRAVGLYVRSWGKSDQELTEQLRRQIPPHYIDRLKALLCDVWVRKELINRGFSYGKDVKEYLKQIQAHMSLGMKPYSHIENEKLRLINSMIDYIYYLLIKGGEKENAFNKGFEEMYRSVDPEAVKLSNQVYTFIIDSEYKSEVKATVLQLLKNLGLTDPCFDRMNSKPRKLE